MEAKKANFEMAEYDHEFIDRLMDMPDVELYTYMQSLPPAQRKMMEEAIFKAVSQRAVKEHIDSLNGGLQS